MRWCHPLRPVVMSAVAHARRAPTVPRPPALRGQPLRAHRAQVVVELGIVVRIQRPLCPRPLLRRLPLLAECATSGVAAATALGLGSHRATPRAREPARGTRRAAPRSRVYVVTREPVPAPVTAAPGRRLTPPRLGHRRRRRQRARGQFVGDRASAAMARAVPGSRGRRRHRPDPARLASLHLDFGLHHASLVAIPTDRGVTRCGGQRRVHPNGSPRQA